MIRAVVFDMDGVLVDSERYWFEARSEYAHERGKYWSIEDQRAVMGVNSREWAGYMVDRLEPHLPVAAMQEEIVRRMARLYAEQMPFLPGAVEAVELASANYPTALASGSHRSLIDTVLASPQMRDKFSLVMCADDVPAGKPAPDVYLETARRLRLPPGECICIEDSTNGILSGLAAGMKVIAVPSREHMPPKEVMARVDLVLDSLRALRLEDIRRL